MLRMKLLALALTLAGLVQAARAADAPPAAERLIPSDALIVLQISDTKALLDLALSEKLREAVTASPAYQQAAGSLQFQQLLNLVTFMESKFGSDWQTALRRLTEGGVTLAALPHDSLLLVVDAADAKLLGDLHDVATFIARNDAQQKGKADAVASADYRGVTGWTLGEGEAHAIVGTRLLVTNKADALKAAIDLQTGSGGSTLADLPAYQAARKAQSGAAAMLYINSGVLKQLPGVMEGLKQERNPMGSLLFAPVVEALAESNWLALGLRVKENTLVLDAATDVESLESSGPARFARPQSAGEGAPAAVDVPRKVAELSLYRDLHAFYAAKDDLFPQRTSEIIFFENMMGIFFTGRDLTEEVFAELAPEVRLVVAGQEYDPSVGTPATQVPGFALVFRMNDPKKFAPVMEEAYQKALGLINFTRGQKAEPGLIIDRSTHGDVKYTVARFAAGADDDPKALDIRFNFQPTLAMPGQYVILSSSEGLARDLIDALGSQAAAAPLANTHSYLEIEGSAVADVLAANREHFIQQEMLEKGSTREEAEAGFVALLTVVERIGRSSVRVGQSQGQPRARLEITLDLEP